MALRKILGDGWETKAKDKHTHVPPPKQDGAKKPPPDKRK